MNMYRNKTHSASTPTVNSALLLAVVIALTGCLEAKEPPKVCTPGVKRCASGAIAVDVCKADGTDWEQYQTCKAGEICNNGRCETPPASCGDGKCDSADENCSNCEKDCGKCCGNGKCEAEYNEVHATCPADCKLPPDLGGKDLGVDSTPPKPDVGVDQAVDTTSPKPDVGVDQTVDTTQPTPDMGIDQTVITPDQAVPDTLTPDMLAPDTLAPDTLSPDAGAPDQGAPTSCTPYSSTTIKSLPIAVGYSATTKPINGKIYIFGGQGNNSAPCYDNVWSYDIAADTMTDLGSVLPYKMCYLHQYDTAIGNNGKVYISPSLGSTFNGGWGSHKCLVEFDPAANTAVERACFASNRWMLRLVRANDGLIYIFGGWNGGMVNEIWTYDAAQNQLTKLSTVFPSALNNYTEEALLGPDGRIYLYHRTDLAVFDPTTKAITVVGKHGLPSGFVAKAWVGNDGKIHGLADDAATGATMGVAFTTDPSTLLTTHKVLASPALPNWFSAWSVDEASGYLYAFGGSTTGLGAGPMTGASLRLGCLPGLDNGIPGIWRTIPAGMFMMGSSASEGCHNATETQHQVALTSAYQIQSTEVTQSQFESVMGYNPSNFSISGAGSPCGGSCPVENVNWHEAVAYTNTLSQMTGLESCYTCTGSGPAVSCAPKATFVGSAIYSCKGYRLPTEAEWERAYRAGTTSAYYAGNNDPAKCGDCSTPEPLLAGIAWYCANSNGSTHPSAQKIPNAWGLFDMAGNVQEWCHDWYDTYPSGVVVDPPDRHRARIELDAVDDTITIQQIAEQQSATTSAILPLSAPRAWGFGPCARSLFRPGS
jgi:formylglycine-generating enzyme required for sulfatase activity